jgi:protein tyrosine phosphatase
VLRRRLTANEVIGGDGGGGGGEHPLAAPEHSPLARTYINANYIRVCWLRRHAHINEPQLQGYDDEPMAFIATQGPLPNTLDDFWLMVWQEKAPAIVMMTKLKENNKVTTHTCTRY